jgi:hypothetical protein
MAKRQNLQMYQGDDYVATVTVSNADGSATDLSGFAVKSQIRRGVADVDADVVAEFTVTIQSPEILLALTHAQTTPLSGNYVWDLQLTDASGTVTTIMAGQVIVTQEVTRSAVARKLAVAV